MHISTQWRRFRRKRKLTQRQLALALGITTRAVKYIEAGAREPRVSTQEKFEALVERHRQAVDPVGFWRLAAKMASGRPGVVITNIKAPGDISAKKNHRDYDLIEGRL